MNVEVHAGSKTKLSDYIAVLEAIEDTKQMTFMGGNATFEVFGD